MIVYPKFQYIKFPTHKFKLLHYTGNGVVENMFMEHGIVAEGDSYQEMELLGDKLFHALNTEEAIKSTWTGDKFKVIF